MKLMTIAQRMGKKTENSMKGFPCDPHHLTRPLKVSKEKSISSLNHFDGTQALMSNFCWRD